MFNLPPRPKHIVLTKEQIPLLNWINDTLMQCSRELYHNPAEAAKIGEKYWDLLGIPRNIQVSSMTEEPWIPGALTALYYERIRTENEVVVLNLEAIEDYGSYDTYVPVVVIKPQIYQVVVASQVENITYVRYDPMQNLHVYILAKQEAQEISGVKQINFNEDYQYNMIDPDTLKDLR